ncbi:hypothetical protein L1987_35389 [Smallanthus sonchifolius]|uniref:Uncharacterized protein n=1 Tax=Smallanthus sonchifolius TaxID=185202 RepID=A0ACB9HXY7_9ASTR|nr:hypothetical protein L1987_35389 [Smallanthus sonchifolius]
MTRLSLTRPGLSSNQAFSLMSAIINKLNTQFFVLLSHEACKFGDMKIDFCYVCKQRTKKSTARTRRYHLQIFPFFYIFPSLISSKISPIFSLFRARPRSENFPPTISYLRLGSIQVTHTEIRSPRYFEGFLRGGVQTKL